MKHILTIIFALITVSASAQSIDGIEISQIDSGNYILVTAQSRLLSSKVTVQVDAGQEVGLVPSSKSIQVRDKDGKPVVFNSPVDAFNFFARSGFRFVQAFATTQGNVNVYNYLFIKS